MSKSILAVIVGYVAMLAFVFGAMLIAVLALGFDRMFKPGVYEPSVLWLVVSFSITAAAGGVGGVVCRSIAKKREPVLALAGIVLLWGAVSLVIALASGTPETPPPPRTADATMIDVGEHSRQPVFVTALNPVIGFFGIMVAGRGFSSRRADVG